MENGAGARTGEGEQKSPKRDWSKAFPASMTALTVAFVGLVGQCALKQREEQITERTMIEQRGQMYIELMSRREESESNIRKDMFTAILGQFFSAEETDLSKQLLKLEMLALNFGESMSLSPLFRELERDMESYEPQSEKDEKDWPIKKMFYRRRLRSLAKRVAEFQLASLRRAESSFTFNLPLEQASTAEGGKRTGVGIRLDGLERVIDLTLRKANDKRQEVDVALKIKTPADKTLDDYDFTLSWFDFPMIDNIRLSNGHRFALAFEKFDRKAVKVIGVLFPGLYGSQRNKPFLDLVVEQLPGIVSPEQAAQQTDGDR